jgi:hypothetical protein
MKFYLIAIDKDGVLQACSDSDLTATNTFRPIIFERSGDATSNPKWQDIAYYASKIFAMDAENNSWNLTIAKGAGTFSVADKTPQQALRGLTANDTGIIAARSDSYLWRRIVDSVSDPNQPIKAGGWTKWMAYGDVKHVGVASPGVYLDLRTLTAALRDQYLETQVALWPVVNKIKAFADTHKTYLSTMQTTSASYNDATDEKERERIKSRSAKQTWRHITRWSKKLYQASANSQAAVVNMTAGLKGVGVDLRAQAESIKSKITQPKTVLEGQKDELKGIKNVQTWSIIVLLVAFVVIMVAMAFGIGWLVHGAGLLFLGAFITEKIYESKEDTALNNIAKTQSQISSLETSLTQLETLAKSFECIEKMYGELNKVLG